MIFASAGIGLVIDNFIAIDHCDTNANVKHCFLTSAHPRHYSKLNSEWQNIGIYCSPITAKLLSVISSQRKLFQISDKWIQPLDLNVWHEMDGFRVMLVDANHAPGAVMLIIESDRRNASCRILYTGSFRADARFYENLTGLSALQEKKFDVIFIDSIYIDFTEEEFPTRRSSAKEAANLIRIMRKEGVDNVAIPVPVLGCESFLVNISRELKCKIWVHPERFEIARILGIEDYFSDKKGNTYVWTCTQREIQEVFSGTNSHVIKTFMTPFVTPNMSNCEREHTVRYSDQCSLAELRSFLALLSFGRVIDIPNALSRLANDELQNLGLPGIETTCCGEEKRTNGEKLFFNPSKLSRRTGLAFDYAFSKLCDRLFTIENLATDKNLREMLPKFESHADNFTREVFNDEYGRHDSQRVGKYSQVICENSSASDTASIFKILLEQYHVSLVLHHLASEFYTENADYGSTQDAKFLFYANISDQFNGFDDSFEEYRDRSVKALSVGVINQQYHTERNICYDSSNAPVLPDVVLESLFCSPISELEQLSSVELTVSENKVKQVFRGDFV